MLPVNYLLISMPIINLLAAFISTYKALVLGRFLWKSNKLELQLKM